MKLNKIQIGLIFTLFFSSTAFACGNPATRHCPLRPETTAYIDHKATLLPGIDIGKLYKEHIEKVASLEKTGNFKNLKISNQSADISPGYNSNEVTSVTFRVTLKFDLNYEALSNIYKIFDKSIISYSTYDARVCPEKD